MVDKRSLWKRVQRLEFCFVALLVLSTLQVFLFYQHEKVEDSRQVEPQQEAPSKKMSNNKKTQQQDYADRVLLPEDEIDTSSGLLKPNPAAVVGLGETQWLTEPFSVPGIPGVTRGDVQRSKVTGPTRSVSIPGVPGVTNARRRNKEPDRWNPELAAAPDEGQVPLKVNRPILVASLPKSGTTSIWNYFRCGGHNASHQWVQFNETSMEQTGKCVRRNIDRELPPFSGCGSTDILTDSGFALYLSGGKLPNVPSDCFYPSIQALDAMYKHHPNATILHVVRNADDWLHSMKVWSKGSLLKRWMVCDVPGFPPWGSSHDDFLDFYNWHQLQLRRFAEEHPSLTFIELALDDPAIGKKLENRIGIRADCWGKCSPKSRLCDRVAA